MEATFAPPISQKAKSIAVPSYLIYEILDGEPIYFKGYQKVLNGEKTKEDIMATGRLQTLIISSLQEHLWANHNHEGLKYMSNEVGIHISTGLNFSCDLVAFDKTVLAATDDDTITTPFRQNSSLRWTPTAISAIKSLKIIFSKKANAC